MSDEKSKNPLRFMEAIKFSMGFGYIIALPLVAAVFGGKWLDARMHTKFLLPLALILSLTISFIWLYKYINKLKDK